MFDKEALVNYIESEIESLKYTLKNVQHDSWNDIRYNGKMNALENLLQEIKIGTFDK